MSVTGSITQGIFWAHVVGAVLVGISSIVVSRLVADLDVGQGGIKSTPLGRKSLERGIPAGILLFGLAILGFGFAYLSDRVAQLDPAVSALGPVERLSLSVPGGAFGKWAGIAGLVVFNGAIVLLLLDLGYQSLTGR